MSEATTTDEEENRREPARQNHADKTVGENSHQKEPVRKRKKKQLGRK